ncbi:MAG: hypothetical protein V1705_01720 [bacterium]
MEKQWVGDVYANFAKADEHPNVLYNYATCMNVRLLGSVIDNIDVFCGTPIGGYNFSVILGWTYNRRVVKAEKKVTALATEKTREQTELVFARHDIERGVRYAIVEDVCNNFSTTETLIALIMSLGGSVTAIVCELNRSLDFEDYYYPSKVAGGRLIPVASLVRKPIPEYRQDDPAVIDDIRIGNVVWKPKIEWPRLMKAMADSRNY